MLLEGLGAELQVIKTDSKTRATLSLGAASDSIRDQVLRHGPNTCVFSAAYRDEFVGFNTQDAYLEEDISNNRLIRAFTHMSI